MNQDVVYLPKDAILRAAEQFETPFFLYKEKRIRENCRRLKTEFSKHFPDFIPLYAVKANTNPELLKIVMDEGFGFDCSSESEVWLAEKLGASGMHTGNYTTEKELKAVLESSQILNLDDESMLPTIEKLGMPKVLSFRVNPGIGEAGIDTNILAGPDAKYGIPFEKISYAYKTAKAMGVEKFGIHMMTGSNVMDDDYFKRIVEKMLDVISDVKEQTGIEISFMNIGGGFGVAYEPYEESINLEFIVKSIRDAMDEKCAEHSIAEPQLYIEPGRYVMADSAWLVGKVQVIKDGYKKFIGIDASTNEMPRPWAYGAYHFASILNDSNETEIVSIVGSMCENRDQFARERELPIASVGDLVVIHNCGAHAISMAHHYNGKLVHAEYLLEGDGGLRKIRRAETFEDLFATVQL